MRALLLCTALLLGSAGAAGAADAGLVAGINGTPTVTRAGQSLPLTRGATVAVGDTIVTAAGAKVKILLADDSVLAIGPGSQVVLDELALAPQSRAAKLRVLAGRFKLAIAAWLTGSSRFEVETPTAVAGVRGTVLWGDTELDAICALHGTIEVRPRQGGSPATLSAGQCVTDMADGKTAPLKPSPAELAAYLRQVTLD
ncbi:MAG: FecR family protein [Deltaproteobacteria bacterium]|nr:FecR family protein [Deltaproteobacteria bacterium]